jgi:hypothetical protein
MISRVTMVSKVHGVRGLRKGTVSQRAPPYPLAVILGGGVHTGHTIPNKGGGSGGEEERGARAGGDSTVIGSSRHTYRGK